MHTGRWKDMTRYLKQNAVFVINCSWDKSEIEKQLPAKMRKDLAEKKAKMWECWSWGFETSKDSNIDGKVNQGS